MSSGDTLLVRTVNAATFPTSNAPVFDWRNNHLVLDFDDTVDQTCYLSGVMPRQYGGSGATVRVYWMGNTQTSGDVVWAVAWERHQDNAFDLDSDGFAADQWIDALTGTVGGYLRYSDIPFSNAQIDGLLVGESFRLRLHRDADNTYATDTLTDNAEFARIEVRET